MRLLQKNICITIGICLAIIFKITLLNFAFLLVNDTSEVIQLSANENFKVGKSRRRFTYYISLLENKVANQEQVFAEKAETENSDELLKKYSLPVILLEGLEGAFNLFNEKLKTLSTFAANSISYLLSSKKFPDVSVLRI